MNVMINTHHDCPTCGRCKHCGRKDEPLFVGAPRTTQPIFLPTGTPAPGDLMPYTGDPVPGTNTIICAE